jgi:hypothetical protein
VLPSFLTSKVVPVQDQLGASVLFTWCEYLCLEARQHVGKDEDPGSVANDWYQAHVDAVAEAARRYAQSGRRCIDSVAKLIRFVSLSMLRRNLHRF